MPQRPHSFQGSTSCVARSSAGYCLLANAVALVCLAAIVDGAVQQTQMLFLNGQILAGNSALKAVLLIAVVAGCMLHPRVDPRRVPVRMWLLSIAFLGFELGYLCLARAMTIDDVLVSYYDYYLLLLIGPVLLVFRRSIASKRLSNVVLWVFLVCATIGLAQYVAKQPILRTESSDGSFTVQSWDFIGDVRAFSLFGSALEFGLFCALCGSLGIALSKTRPITGACIWLIAAISCFATLTRICYLAFACASLSALIFTYGKKQSRGRWSPAAYFFVGLITLIAGLSSLAVGSSNNLEDTGSLFMRVNEWSFYYNLLSQSTLSEWLFGLGIVQNQRVQPRFPMIIDNSPLALTVHIGLVGLLVFSVLIWKMWLYLRDEAVTCQQPFIIAAASLWSTLACVGLFNIVFGMFGAVFALSILCQRATPTIRSTTRSSTLEVT